MGSLGFDRVGNPDLRRVGRTGIKVDAFLGHKLLRRGSEIPGVASMNRRRVGHFPQRVQARTELVLVSERRSVVEANSVVNGQTRVEPPLILNVETAEVTPLVGIVDD